MEMQKVPQSRLHHQRIMDFGIQRKLTLDNAMFPFKLLSVWEFIPNYQSLNPMWLLELVVLQAGPF